MRQPSDVAPDLTDGFRSMMPPRTYPHTGLDWPCGIGSNVYAIQDATVTAAGWHSGNGNYVAIHLPNGMYWSYIHLNEILVSTGQKVSEGQVIARSGATGTNARGAHLHCSYSDSPQVYVGMGNLQDPWVYLNSPQPSSRKGKKVYAIQQSDNGAIYVVAPGFIHHIEGPYDWAQVRDITGEALWKDPGNIDAVLRSLDIPVEKKVEVLGGKTWSRELEIKQAVEHAPGTSVDGQAIADSVLAGLSGLNINVDALAQAIADRLNGNTPHTITKDEVLTAIEANYQE